VPITQQTLYKEVGVHTVDAGSARGWAMWSAARGQSSTATLVVIRPHCKVQTSSIPCRSTSTVSRLRRANVALRRPPKTILLQQGRRWTVTVRRDHNFDQSNVRVPPSVIKSRALVQLAHPLDLVAVTISGPAPALSTSRSTRTTSGWCWMSTAKGLADRRST